MRRLQGIFKLNEAIGNPKTVPKQWIRADHVQMESSEGVKMLEKQRCRAGCVNPCERNTLERIIGSSDVTWRFGKCDQTKSQRISGA
jgi:hypothetical protein